jgi:type VI secretion system secreted protein VgrG
MAGVLGELKAYGAEALRNAVAVTVTGRQAYFLEVPGSVSAAGLSVVSFEAVERLGEPMKSGYGLHIRWSWTGLST